MIQVVPHSRGGSLQIGREYEERFGWDDRIAEQSNEGARGIQVFLCAGDFVCWCFCGLVHCVLVFFCATVLAAGVFCVLVFSWADVSVCWCFLCAGVFVGWCFSVLMFFGLVFVFMCWCFCLLVLMFVCLSLFFSFCICVFIYVLSVYWPIYLSISVFVGFGAQSVFIGAKNGANPPGFCELQMLGHSGVHFLHNFTKLAVEPSVWFWFWFCTIELHKTRFVPSVHFWHISTSKVVHHQFFEWL